MNEVRGWLQRRRLTLAIILFFVGWHVLQLSVLHVFGENVARWWFYFAKPPNAVSPGIFFGPISHQMNTITHIAGNILFLFIAGGFAEPYISKKRLLFLVFGLGYLGIYLANATAWIHQLWMFAGASGGILSLWAYAGLKLRHKTKDNHSEPILSREGVEQFTAVFLILMIPAILLREAVFAAQFHSGHVIGLLLGCMYFGYDSYFTKA